MNNPLNSFIFAISLLMGLLLLFCWHTAHAKDPDSIPLSIVTWYQGKPVNLQCSVNTKEMIVLCAGEKVVLKPPKK